MQKVSIATTSQERGGWSRFHLVSFTSGSYSLSVCVRVCALYDRTLTQLSVLWTAHVIILGLLSCYDAMDSRMST